MHVDRCQITTGYCDNAPSARGVETSIGLISDGILLPRVSVKQLYEGAIRTDYICRVSGDFDMIQSLGGSNE